MTTIELPNTIRIVGALNRKIHDTHWRLQKPAMPDPVPSFELIQFNPLVQRKSPLKGQRRRKPRSHRRRRPEHGDQRHRQNSGGQRRHSWLLLFVFLFQTLSPSPLPSLSKWYNIRRWRERGYNTENLEARWRRILWFCGERKREKVGKWVTWKFILLIIMNLWSIWTLPFMTFLAPSYLVKPPLYPLRCLHVRFSHAPSLSLFFFSHISKHISYCWT